MRIFFFFLYSGLRLRKYSKLAAPLWSKDMLMDFHFHTLFKAIMFNLNFFHYPSSLYSLYWLWSHRA